MLKPMPYKRISYRVEDLQAAKTLAKTDLQLHLPTSINN